MCTRKIHSEYIAAIQGTHKPKKRNTSIDFLNSSSVVYMRCGRDTFWGQTYHVLLIPLPLQISIQDPANLNIKSTDNDYR